MTEAMPFLQKAILLSYDPRPFERGLPYRLKRRIVNVTPRLKPGAYGANHEPD